MKSFPERTESQQTPGIQPCSFLPASVPQVFLIAQKRGKSAMIFELLDNAIAPLIAFSCPVAFSCIELAWFPFVYLALEIH